MSLAGQKVAVIGAGVSGLASAWLLQAHGAEVTLYESEDKCGGHTLTDTTTAWPVDLGFQVYNLTTYPHLIGWFEQLGVTTEPSDMSFALSVDGGALEWASHNLSTIFAQRKNLTDLSFLGMLWDVIRFGREAPKVLAAEHLEDYKNVTLKTFLDSGKYSECFRSNYLAPMCAAVWSVPNAQVMEFPVQMLVRFWKNHHLLDIFQRPLWRVVKGRSQQYVAKVLAGLPEVLTATPVEAVTRVAGGGVAVTACGVERVFQKVVLATHSDVSRALRGADATPEEASVLEAIAYNESTIYLHSDLALMPVNRNAWASWNFLGHTGDGADTAAVCVSYWLNLLQHLPPDAPDLFVTLNPRTPPAADKTHRRLTLAHPVFNFDSWRAQERIPAIQNTGGIYYAGAWCGYGFHEDGMRSAVAMLSALGLRPPWAPRATSPKASLLETYFQGRLEAWAAAGLARGTLHLVLPSGEEREFGGAPAGHRLRLVVPSYPVILPAPGGTSSTAAAALVPPAELPPSSTQTGPCEATMPLTATVRVLTLTALQRVVCRDDVGLGEAFATRELEVSDLGALALVLAMNQASLAAARGRAGMAHWLGGKALLGAHLMRPASIEGLCISHERFLDTTGTAFHRLFLGDRLLYGPAWHCDGQASFQDAQDAAISGILAAVPLRHESSVLEVGCGWGAISFAGIRQFKCRWAATTLVKCQLEHVSARARELGPEAQLQLQFGDWRDLLTPTLPGPFDTVLCVDPVTTATLDPAALGAFFLAVAAALVPGGELVLLAITVPDADAEAEMHSTSFAREHLLWGMHLPTRAALVAAAAGAGLALAPADAARTARPLAGDFAATLRHWRACLTSQWRQALALGVRDATLRKYEFGMAMAEASFEAGLVECTLLTWRKPSDASSSSESANVAADFAVTEQRNRLLRHFEVTKPVISGFVRALQCAALVFFGILVNQLFEFLLSRS